MTGGPDIDAQMRALAQGDRSVFTSLFAALWPPVREVCRRMLAGDAEADDAAQTAMVKLFEHASAYDPRRPALPWALGIAAWECRTVRQRRARAKETPALPERSDGGATAEAVEQRELLEAVQAALGELGAADRDVLIDTYWERAEVTGATQRKRRQRALERLRAAFRRIHGLD